MISCIKSQSGELFTPIRRIPTVTQCPSLQSINAIVGRLMMLKYFAGKGHPIQLSMNMAGFCVRDSEKFYLEVNPPDERGQKISYKMEIKAIPPEGFDTPEMIEIRQNGNLVETIEKAWEIAYVRRRRNEQLYPIDSHDISIVSLLKDRCLSLRRLGEIVERWFFYIPVSGNPLRSIESFRYETETDVAFWLRELLKQEQGYSNIVERLSIVQPCAGVHETDDGRVGISLVGERLIHFQGLLYALGVITALLSSSTSFVVLVRPERFIPSENERSFLEMVRETKGNKDVLILTESQTMSRHLPVSYQMVEDEYGWEISASANF